MEEQKRKLSRKTILIIALCILIVLLAGWGIYRRYFTKEGGGLGIFYKLTTAPSAIQALSLLDGKYYSQDVANRHPLAIMIENSPDARPQTGLTKASIIYEAITEGGITRFMAIFGPQSSKKVGPVRSARSFFLDWAAEYDAFYAHVGGSLEALDKIKEYNIKDLNQFSIGSKAFWRLPQAGKATEHTMYTNTDKLWQIANQNKWSMIGAFPPLAFKKDLPSSQRPSSQTITIDFSSPTFQVVWQYNPSSNEYLRKMAGSLHKDGESGEQMKAKNVIVQYVERWQASYKGQQGVWQMKTIGEGRTKVFLDGQTIEGTWKKVHRSARTKFYESTGKEIQFNAGVFWYEIVPPEISVTSQ